MVVLKEPDTVNKEAHHPSAPHRPRAEPAAKKSRAPVKPPPDPDAVFPCKKCGRYGQTIRDLLRSFIYFQFVWVMFAHPVLQSH